MTTTTRCITADNSISSLLRSSLLPPRFYSIDTIDPVSPTKVGLEPKDEIIVSDLDTKWATSARWFRPTAEALADLLRLSDGWNSYGAKRVQPKAVETMLEFLISVLAPNSAPPTVVPTSQGGVQVEWHQGGVDLEIEATAFGKLLYFFSGPDEESEGPVEASPAMFERFTKRLEAV